jgi:hypothetical protein
MFACKKVEVSGQFKVLHNEELCDLYRSPFIEPAKEISRAVGIKVLG